MEQLPLSPSYATWLLGQSVAVVVLALWVISLLRLLKQSSRQNLHLQTRNGELCDSLVELVQSRSQERSDATTSEVQTVLESLERVLQPKRSG